MSLIVDLHFKSAICAWNEKDKRFSMRFCSFTNNIADLQCCFVHINSKNSENGSNKFRGVFCIYKGSGMYSSISDAYISDSVIKDNNGTYLLNTIDNFGLIKVTVESCVVDNPSITNTVTGYGRVSFNPVNFTAEYKGVFDGYFIDKCYEHANHFECTAIDHCLHERSNVMLFMLVCS